MTAQWRSLRPFRMAMIILVGMVAKTHRLVSGSSALVAVTAVGLPISIAAPAAGVAALSSSWPDDVEKLLRLKHRRASHYPSLQAVVLSVPVVAAAIWLPVAVLIVAALAVAAWFGCVMHSVADSMTVEQHGIALLWPISRRGYHLLPRSMRVWVGTKSRSEWVFAALWSLFVLSYLYARYRHLLQS
jgi:membrane-bound metal-dependent hydrolase YbcI (DUF457 family)